MTGTLQAYAFVWGAVWGSFLNVVIYRLPRDLSLVYPGSRCGACGTPIRWFDNVPVLSYLLLRGRCRACRASYSPRYPLIEATCGVLALAVFNATVLPLAPETFLDGLLTWFWLQAFIYGLVSITFIDLEHTFIPDEITYPFIGVGLFGAFALTGVEGLPRLYGAIAGGGFMLMVSGVGWLIYRREALGLGDAKLMAMMGAFLGWKALPFVLFASAVQALLATGVARAYTAVTNKPNSLTMTVEQLDEAFGESELMAERARQDMARRFRRVRRRMADTTFRQRMRRPAVRRWRAWRRARRRSRLQTVVPYGPFLALAGLEALLFGDDLLWRLAEEISVRLLGWTP